MKTLAPPRCHLLLGGLSFVLGLGCDDGASGESQACRDYKQALAPQAHCDPEFTPLLGDDEAYESYRCRTEEELAERGLTESLAECAEYLQGLLGPEVDSGLRGCEVRLTERERCKTGYLVFEGAGTLPNDDVGKSCEVSSMPQGGFRADEVYLELAPQGTCTSCLVEGLQGDPSADCDPDTTTCPSAEAVEDGIYCSCRCRGDDPDAATCACPDGFECREGLARGGPGIRGDYCMRAD